MNLDTLQPGPSIDTLADGFFAALANADDLAGRQALDEAEEALNRALSGLALYEAALSHSDSETPAFDMDPDVGDADTQADEPFAQYGVSKFIINLFYLA